ncbi:MAG TPA: DUF1566 domain-containing protein, partial [Agitococcus sp.]|nr:DUF1566 domain-containing protein [Agitococcus sp.]
MPDIPRQQLAYILTQFGRSICDDPKRCEALLKDLCPNHKREVNLLLAALREGVVTELLNASPLVPIESSINRLTLKMHNNLGTDKLLAQWAVESWTMVLGIQFNSSIIVPSPDKAKVGMGLPKSAESIKLINQPSQAIINQFKGWQKIGLQGEKLAADAPQWAAVIDEKTQLMWAINSSKTASFPNPNKRINWKDAMTWANYVNTQGWCGFNNWRLPTIDELKTLLTQRKQPNLYIREDIFSDIPKKYYWAWSSSPFAALNSHNAWIVNFYGGYSYYYDKGYERDV